MKNLALFSSLLVLFGVSAKASTPSKMIEITWEESLKLAQENNNELKAAIESYKQTYELESGARSGFLPTLTGSVTASQSMLSSVSTNSTQTDSATLSLSQNIFSGFSDSSKFKQAQINTEVAKYTLQIAEAKIRSDLMQGLGNYLYAIDSVALSQKILDRRKENSRIVELRFSGGRENKGSVLLSEAYYQQAQYEYLLAKENLKVAESNLKSLLGFSQESELKFKGLLPLIDPNSIDLNIEKTVIIVPDFKLAITQEEATHLSVDISKSNFYPSLDLTASTGKTDQTWALNYDKWSTALTLTIPFYSGGKDNSSMKSNTAKWQSALQSRISTQAKLFTQLKQSYTNYLLSAEKIKVDEKFRTAALTRSEIARTKYNNGLMSFEEWDQVESDLILREKNAISSKRDRVTAEAAFNQILGVGVNK